MPTPRRVPPLVVFAVLFATVSATKLAAVDGALDPSFFTDGKIVTGGSSDWEVSALVAAPDGRLVVVGTHLDGVSGADEWFWRAFDDLSFDPVCSFFPPGGATRGAARAALFDAAGRLVVAGAARYGTDRFAVARFAYPNCALDPAFDDDGYYTLDLPGGSETISAIARSPVGILAFGGSHHDGTGADFAVLELSENGVPIPTFSGDGWTTLDISGAELDDTIQAIAFDSQHRVVAAGNTYYGASGQNSDFIVVRFTTAGVPDAAFDGDGIARVAFDLGGSTQRFDALYALAIDPATQAIVVAGQAQAVSTWDLAIARLTSGGAPDTSFSSDGRLNNNFGFSSVRANEVLVDGLGRVTVAGVATPFSGSSGSDFFAARFTKSGSVDNTFSGNGWTVVPFDLGPTVYVTDTARAATFQGGRLALAGEAIYDTDSHARYALARLEVALAFADGFESGNVRQWSSATGAPER